MNLTTAIVAKFIDGDIEIQNEGENYLFRGPIKAAVVVDNVLTIEVNWLAKNESGPKSPGNWTSTEPKPWIASLEIYSAQENTGRIILQSSIVGEMVVLFPKNGSKLNPVRVIGLEPQYLVKTKV